MARVGVARVQQQRVVGDVDNADGRPGREPMVAANQQPLALEVELWSASAFAHQTVAFTNTGKPQPLRGLGHGAFYSPVKGNKNDGNVLFERGAYTVVIDPTRIGGPSADYPTEHQYVALARAIYKHLG
jgi:hypothetical protein